MKVRQKIFLLLLAFPIICFCQDSKKLQKIDKLANAIEKAIADSVDGYVIEVGSHKTYYVNSARQLIKARIIATGCYCILPETDTTKTILTFYFQNNRLIKVYAYNIPNDPNDEWVYYYELGNILYPPSTMDENNFAQAYLRMSRDELFQDFKRSIAYSRLRKTKLKK